MNLMFDRRCMRRAISLSRIAAGKTRPNPSVGCVLARNGAIIGEGYHRGPGTPHAEVEAIQQSPAALLRGATCYVTLEPCNHWGRTPPCTDALVDSGIHRVVIAVRDPNPSVTGGGIEKLRAAGLQVELGFCAPEALDVIEPWCTYVTTGKPFVLLKMAMSLDGRVATYTGESRWISGKVSRRMVHRLRQQFAGIMVGAGTIRADNPRLTARKNGKDIAAPVRIVVDRFAEAPADAAVFNPALPGKTVWAVSEKHIHSVTNSASRHVDILPCPETPDGLDLAYLMHELGTSIGLESVLLEGGPTLAFSMIKSRLVHKVMLFIAPKLIGGITAAVALGGDGFAKLETVPQLHHVKIRKSGEDVLITGYLGDRVCLRE